MNILVTGGAGYIGTHTLIELITAGHSPIVIDNFSNSSPEALRRVERISGTDITCYKGDVCDTQLLKKIFAENMIDAVIHFAGLKAVGESVAQPLKYYRNNIDSSLALCETMQHAGVKNIIFSSSATVYGVPQELPLKETSPTGQGIPNPYGQTKYIIEQILYDIARADNDWHIIALRYFNPIGAHESGLIGEDPNDIPNNLMPFISQVAVGRLEKLRVFGNDYDTKDGTALRDYIHVVDLAKGHVAALNHLFEEAGTRTYNLGTGRAVSVLQAVHAFEKVSGKQIAYEVVARRPGDVAICYADATKAKNELKWQTNKTLEDACADAWRWQSKNPEGYGN